MTKADATMVNDSRADYAGVVFASGRHQVDGQQAQSIRATLDPAIPLVGVFVDQAVDEIIGLGQAGIIQMAQLHGPYGSEVIAAIQASGLAVIDVTVGQDQAEEFVNQVAGPDNQNQADFYLVDSGAGSGQTLDWSRLQNLPKDKTLVAGGINLTNIEKILALNSYGIDISSGSETNGHKDPAKIRQLVALAHQERE